MAMARGRDGLEGRRHLSYHADDSVAAGRVLIVSRWPYDERKRLHQTAWLRKSANTLMIQEHDENKVAKSYISYT